MYAKLPTDTVLPEVPYGQPVLPYEKPELGVNLWVKDDFFADAKAKKIANRCFNPKKWKLGKPYSNELWPGMRSPKALKVAELKQVEDWVKSVIGKDKLWFIDSGDVTVDHNSVHLTGEKEGAPRPHTDSRKLCRYAAVLYLNTNPAPHAGTSFYRLRYTNGAAGGNVIPPQFNNLVDALKVNSLPPEAWYEEYTVENRFNRLVVFKGNMIHGANGYFGVDKRDRRLVALFFWMTED